MTFLYNIDALQQLKNWLSTRTGPRKGQAFWWNILPCTEKKLKQFGILQI